MTYEATVSYVNAEGKNKKEACVIENAETFADAEAQLYHEFDGEQKFDVLALKRSAIKEIANQREDSAQALWVAELMSVFFDDVNEVEKATKYKILFFSDTYDHANAFINEYIKQGYDLSLVGLKLTKFKEVI